MKKPSLTPLVTQRDEYAEDAIRFLNEALKQATERPQSSIVIHMVGRDGVVKTYYSTLNADETVGMLASAQHFLMAGTRD